MTIQEKAKKIVEIRNKINELKEKMDKLKAERDKLQADIIEHLKRLGFNSIKTQEAMISRQVARTLTIVDEKALVEDLKKKGLNDYIREQVDRNLWRGLATEAIKQGQKFKGTEIKESEFISVRKVKPKIDKEIMVSDSGSAIEK